MRGSRNERGEREKIGICMDDEQKIQKQDGKNNIGSEEKEQNYHR